MDVVVVVVRIGFFGFRFVVPVAFLRFRLELCFQLGFFVLIVVLGFRPLFYAVTSSGMTSVICSLKAAAALSPVMFQIFSP